MTSVTLTVEATKSRTGLHAARSVVLVIEGDQVSIISRPVIPGKGTYSRGTAGYVEVEVPPNGVIVHFWLVLNPRRRVKGVIRVYGFDGQPVLEARLAKRKIRRISGDPSYAWAIEKAVEKLKLSRHVRRYNWATGVDRIES